MRSLWHFAQGPETKCGQEWVKMRLDTAGTLQAWHALLTREQTDKRFRCCFRCAYEVAKETNADRVAFLTVTIMKGGRSNDQATR